MSERDGPATFDVSKTVNYWSESATYDLEVARSLIETRKFPYALFFCHLGLEKMLKAAVVKNTQRHAAYAHSLPLLAQRSGTKHSSGLFDQVAGIYGISDPGPLPGRAIVILPKVYRDILRQG